MDDEMKIKMYSFTVDCKDPNRLAKVYDIVVEDMDRQSRGLHGWQTNIYVRY